jgi:hypothetical protein
VARAAITAAARRHAPGLVRGRPADRSRGRFRPRRGGYGGSANGWRNGGGGDQGGFDDGQDGDGDGDDAGAGSQASSGRWVRDGRTIVIHGA